MRRFSAEKDPGAHALMSMLTPGDDKPVTRVELRAELHEMREEFNQRLERMQQDLVEQMRDMQTEVLRAFHGWGRPVEMRLRLIDDLQVRLGLLEERMSAMERGDKPAA